MMRCTPETVLNHARRHSACAASAPGAGEPRVLGDVVQQIVTRLLPDGSPEMRSVAELVGVTTRTLQRRLSAEGLTFVAIVAHARLEVARRMLDDPARKVIDVALDLGYSDPAHFTRAFSRWTGVTPRDFRRLGSADRQQLVAP